MELTEGDLVVVKIIDNEYVGYYVKCTPKNMVLRHTRESCDTQMRYRVFLEAIVTVTIVRGDPFEMETQHW